ncbi:MAG: radical SAM protein [Clostridia bacterium]|nr:radical SAM protein [Clostridia bacterium]
MQEITLKKCNLCPRMCGVDRRRMMGICRSTHEMKIARAALHFWEEPPISGKNGSGTVFFSGCNLGCVYCQNRQISRGAVGKTVTPGELAEIFARLEREGAHNINLVTPTHFSLPITESVAVYRQKGGRLPVVYNTGGYEREEIIAFLKDTVDIYLTDLKYAEGASAARYSFAADYPETARKALAKMVKTVGAPVFDEEGILQKGVIVRLLVLPGIEHEAMMNLKYLKETFGDAVIVSLMNQYTPVGEELPPELQQPLEKAAYETAVAYARKLNFKYAYIQEGETAKESFIPPFLETESIKCE